jgi:phosphoribosylglycinamide formyltransferase-1
MGHEPESHSVGGVSYTAAALVSRRQTIDIAVLASGSGTNLQALIDAPGVRSHISIVISDNGDAPALVRARDAGIATGVVGWEEFDDRASFSTAVADVVEEGGAKGVVLAGFMRVLASSFIDRFPNRILNVHPSLLPAFPGAHAVEHALEHGVKLTGVTVHFVDEKVDNGPIIAQVPVRVLPEDTVESLHARIKVEEHRLYPEVVEAFVSGRLNVVGRKVVSS